VPVVGVPVVVVPVVAVPAVESEGMATTGVDTFIKAGLFGQTQLHSSLRDLEVMSEVMSVVRYTIWSKLTCWSVR
jgi:hypothetical protein